MACMTVYEPARKLHDHEALHVLPWGRTTQAMSSRDCARSCPPNNFPGRRGLSGIKAATRHKGSP